MATSSSPLQGITDSGRAPQFRVKDARSASEIVNNLYEAGKKRLSAWAAVDAKLDGAPPFVSSHLRAAGQSWRSNVPTMEGKAFASAATTPFYDLFRASATFATIQIDTKNPVRADAVSRSVSVAFHEILDEWPDFYFRMWSMLNDFVRHGRGFQFWNESASWKNRHIQHHRVFVPEQTQIDIEDFSVIFVQQNTTVSTLWKMVRNERQARALGWNVAEAKRCMRQAYQEKRSRTDNPVEVEAALRDNDIWLDSLCQQIPIANLFVKEFDGSWTHMIVEWNSGNDANEFLFRKANAFSETSHFVSPFFFEVMNGSFNGASGLGKDIHPIISHRDRIWNSIMDAVYLRTGVNLQATDASSLRRISNVQIGGAMNVWPPGFNALNSQVLGDLRGTMEIMVALDQMLEKNTGIYRPRIERDQGNPATATEMQIRFNQAMVLQSSSIDRFYTQLDRYYAEVWRRMVADRSSRQALLDKLKSSDVKESDLSRPASVKATRSIGNGSPGSRQQAVMSMANLVGSFPELGRQRWLNDAIGVMAGQSKVEQWNPPPPERDTPDEQTWEAASENADLASGAPVLRYPQQNDLIHLRTHLQFASQSAASLQQGADPVKVLGILEGVGKHSVLHLQALSSDELRSAEVKQLEELWKQLAGVTDKLRQQVQKQMREQANAQQQAQAQNGSPEAAKLSAEIGEKQMRLDMDRRMMDERIQLERTKTLSDIENKRAKTMSDIEARKAQTQVNLQEDLATKNQ